MKLAQWLRLYYSLVVKLKARAILLSATLSATSALALLLLTGGLVLAPVTAVVLLLFMLLGVMHGLDRTAAYMALALLAAATLAVATTVHSLFAYALSGGSGLASTWSSYATVLAAALLAYASGYLWSLSLPYRAEPIESLAVPAPSSPPEQEAPRQRRSFWVVPSWLANLLRAAKKERKKVRLTGEPLL